MADERNPVENPDEERDEELELEELEEEEERPAPPPPQPRRVAPEEPAMVLYEDQLDKVFVIRKKVVHYGVIVTFVVGIIVAHVVLTYTVINPLKAQIEEMSVAPTPSEEQGAIEEGRQRPEQSVAPQGGTQEQGSTKYPGIKPRFR